MFLYLLLICQCKDECYIAGCCIYEKPKVFGESDTSSDEEDNDGCTPHCKGHKKKCYRHHKPHSADAGKDQHSDQDNLHKDGEN